MLWEGGDEPGDAAAAWSRIGDGVASLATLSYHTAVGYGEYLNPSTAPMALGRDAASYAAEAAGFEVPVERNA